MGIGFIWVFYFMNLRTGVRLVMMELQQALNNAGLCGELRGKDFDGASDGPWLG